MSTMFASAGVIVTDLPHDLKTLRSHLPTSERLFTVVSSSISCSDSHNEVLVEANKTWGSLDTQEMPLLNTRRNRTYNENRIHREKSRNMEGKEETKSSKRITRAYLPPHYLNSEM